MLSSSAVSVATQTPPPPFKSSGRQVCSGCGWSSKPIKAAPESQSTEQVEATPQIDLKERISAMILSLTKQQLIVIGCLAVASIIGIGSKIAWVNSKVYCVNEDKKVAADVLKPYVAKWEDRIDLANSTSRMSLPSVIRELQDVKREVKSEKWGKCAEPTVNLLTSSMDYEIEAFIKFLDSDTPDFIIQGKMRNARSKMEEFEEDYLTLQFEQPRKFGDKYLAEQEAKELLSTLWIKQEFAYR